MYKSTKTPNHKHLWWKEAVFYQIYPASFKDSNADGWGDIPGLISKLPYVRSLGVDVVWLSPMYESPQADMGYDISNYEAVYAPYGTIEDVDELVKACHDLGMKFMLDLVINHTSDQHAWFNESRSSKTNPKRDWYIWRPARYDEKGERIPPTNWRSYFAGNTWTWDETTQEYYLHIYSPSQPDLNWENPECRKAVYASAMHFWLARGIDGFRVDTVNKYSKDTSFPDAPITDPTTWIQAAPQFWCNGPRVHEFIKEMKTTVLDHYHTFDGGPIVTVGELSMAPNPLTVLEYVSAARGELDMVFQFDMVGLGQGKHFDGKYDFLPWELSTLESIVEKWQTFIDDTDSWTTVFSENHDSGRSVSRWGSDDPLWRDKSAKMLTLMQIAQSGTLFLYQGQEIGMVNAPKDWPIEEYKDIEAQNLYKEAIERGDQDRIQRLVHGLQLMGRDNARLPMQWDGSANAGFSAAEKTWMRVHDLYREINVEKQEADAHSVLQFWKKMLRLRKEYSDVFIYGRFELLSERDENLFVFRKIGEGKRNAVACLNFSQNVRMLGSYGSVVENMKVLVSTYGEGLGRELKPFEGRIYVDQ
ncbi:glycoside hydrolase family 13 protein [Lepidopterella palustris CBS 459.81]|uniref:Alpha-glucosidase n=1 Tax=Lepidopterella palustris CBS 459.81 TaxID=1314670 RepID=A0A8E2JH39_9PEZI|nr:glycoside hydrolase family 13 protein [Lepidopterella palustris CBS 459.81]